MGRSLWIATSLLLGACASSDGDALDERREIDFEDRNMWFSFVYADDPPLGVGLSLIETETCDVTPNIPPVVIKANHVSTESFEILHLNDIVGIPRIHFVKENFADFFLSSSANPFATGGALRASAGTLSFTPDFQPFSGDARSLSEEASIRVEFEAQVEGDTYRPFYCEGVSATDGSFESTECRCANGFGEVKECKLEKSGSDVDVSKFDQECCDQLQGSSGRKAVVYGSFRAKFCPNYCGQLRPGLIHQWCPRKSRVRNTEPVESMESSP